MKRGKQETCEFQNGQGDEKDLSKGELQRRLRRLENLVLGVLHGQSNAHPSSSPNTDTLENSRDTNVFRDGLPNHETHLSVAPSVGRLKIDENGTAYKTGHHWTTILDEVMALNDMVDSYDLALDGAGANLPDLALLSGRLGTTTPDEILCALPERKLADRLISCYHRAKEPASLVIHWPTFLHEYNEFWDNPFAADKTWVALLFSILSMGVHVNGRTEEIPLANPLELASSFRIKAAQYLQLADYAKFPGGYTVPTLLIYLQTEFFRSTDALADLWSLNGLTVGIALRLGLHRDPDQYPQISAFDGEMRRRAWALLFQIDLLYSCQVGLPKFIRLNECDTRLPGNLLDEDIDKSTATLPPPRPDTDQTPASYTRAKGRIARAFSPISDAINSVGCITIDEICNLDEGLEKAHLETPNFLQLKERSVSFTDPPYLLMQRYNLNLLYLKARCALHRKSMMAGIQDKQYQQSRKICIDTALSLLDRQVALDEDCQPGGLLEKDSWFVSSLTTSDFLLAATVVCLDICSESKEGSATIIEDHRLQSIARSYQVWSRTPSKEAQKATQVMSIILARAKGKPPISPAITPVQSTNHSLGMPTEAMDFEAFDWGTWDAAWYATPDEQGPNG